MDNQQYTAGMRELRAVRDNIAAVRKKLAGLESARNKQIVALARHATASADKIAPAAGLSILDVVAIAPALGPDQAADTQPEQPPTTAPTAATPARTEPQPTPPAEPEPAPTAPPAQAAPAVAPDSRQPEQPPGDTFRTLPSIPDGPAGDRWFASTKGLASVRPNFTQQPRAMAFLDTDTGVLVYRDHTVRLDLGTATAGEILTAVYATVPDTVERIFITAGAPWHRDSDRYPYLRDAVAAWLNAPIIGWSVESSRGKDRMAGHLVHERNPVGRWQRGDQHTEIRSVHEWFDPDGASPSVVRDAFVLLWQALKPHWNDVVLMGSPSQTGRDLWTRTIPAKAGARWADGYPVMSEEIRGLLHATAGQGRTQLITPPQVPDELPQLVEYDRTFAYARHCWRGGVGVPRRLTGQAFAGLTEKEQTSALFKPSHWNIKVTVPHDWQHVGMLPAPIPGERAWDYPDQPGQSWTTWAGGPEVKLARDHGWQVEILDGLVWEEGKPLHEWSTRLKSAWESLTAQSELHADPQQRTAAYLASRAVRSVLLYGIGGFAQRPRMITGTVPAGRDQDLPPGARIISEDDNNITFQRVSGFSRDPNAHPEWAAGVWSGARAALLDMLMRDDGVHVGALHLPPRSVVAFRTDAIYTTQQVDWPYHRQPGDYLLKGRLGGPIPAPTTEQELLDLRALGREQLRQGATQ
ncbi:hypothetical protein RVR_P151 (plasmid) [Actinacidiphila reveromycinica]|uniref:Mucin-19 n=1 Tax=Actinacidiphila reveromycinica TaxID=659352 RepID=A0A7U3QW51_9ACTN|nr:hypothetical protein [Streptomyces sp. SN-593]BBG20674.1 hypothetical protein RVR_P151 [Streptomyces sp. SN-593]